MEQRGSNEPSPPASTSGPKVPEAPAAAAAPVESGAQPTPGRRPFIAVAIAGALAGTFVVVALLSVRTNPPIETAEAASVAPPPSSPASVVDSSPPPTWAGARRTSWAPDGSKTITFTLTSTRDLPVWMSFARPMLVVRCLYRATEVFVVLDTSASFEDDADRRTVRVQWDDDAERVQQWAVSESGKELFAPDGIAVVRQMAGASRLRFGFTPFNAQPVTAEFAVEGFDQRADLVASTCGWRFDDRARQTARN